MDNETVLEQADILLETKLSELKVRGYSRLKALLEKPEVEHVSLGRVMLIFRSWATRYDDQTLRVIAEASHKRLFRKSHGVRKGFLVGQRFNIVDLDEDDTDLNSG